MAEQDSNTIFSKSCDAAEKCRQNTVVFRKLSMELRANEMRLRTKIIESLREKYASCPKSIESLNEELDVIEKIKTSKNTNQDNRRTMMTKMIVIMMAIITTVGFISTALASSTHLILAFLIAINNIPCSLASSKAM